MRSKYKILMLSDLPLCFSGVGVQARFLIEGLIATGKYSFRCLGGAIKHAEYRTMMVNPDFVVKPVDGFGSQEQVRQILLTDRPDAVLIFTDPRQFIWLWEMQDEISQVCPITYWHIWDNYPYPEFNNVWYESTDLINCISWPTYDMVKSRFPERTNYIPHAFPNNVYYKLPDEQIKQLRQGNFKDKADWFIGLWVNRNAGRKMPSHVMAGFKTFLDNLEKEKGHRKAMLIMHTDPTDGEGPNLYAVADMLGITQNIWFSTHKLDFPDMNLMYNSVDYTINVSKAEGFGLGTLSSLQVGRPIIALKTGGETRQVVNPVTGFEYGVGIEPRVKTLVGSQLVPYIYDDMVHKDDIADAMMKLYNKTPEEIKEIGTKAMEYVQQEYNFNNMITGWDLTLEDMIQKFKNKQTPVKSWSLIDLSAPAQVTPNISRETIEHDTKQLLPATLKQVTEKIGSSIVSRQPKRIK